MMPPMIVNHHKYKKISTLRAHQIEFKTLRHLKINKKRGAFTSSYL